MIASLFKDYDTVLFDFDGTLIDSTQDLVNALNVTLSLEKLSAVPTEIARPFAGVGVKALLECGYKYHNTPLSTHKRDVLSSVFMETYARIMLQHTCPYQGATELLQTLHASKKRLILATNKPKKFTSVIIPSLGWDIYFTALACPEDVSARKPDPAHLLDAMRIAGGLSSNAVMVGDTDADYNAAIGADIDVIMVNFHNHNMDGYSKAKHILTGFV